MSMTSENQPVDLISSAAGLMDIGRQFYSRGWSMGTSSNYSVVMNHQPLELLITASGKDKGQLGPDDFVQIDGDGRPLTGDQPKSSAETMLHVAIAADSNVGAILHTHSVWGTLLSELQRDSGEITLAGYEMLKGLQGVATHDVQIPIKVFENTQDIPALADELVRLRASGEPSVKYAFLMSGHGLYTWGRDLEEARRHVEVLEFLFEVVGRKQTILNQ